MKLAEFEAMTHDELSKLYKSDPEAYQEHCKELIEDTISQFPECKQEALRQLQWRIDGELRKYKDPLARMNKMIEMFWEGVIEFNDVLNR